MDFLDKAKKTINKGLEASGKAFSKAKDAAKDLGDKGVVRVELMQLEKKEAALTAELGEIAYQMLQVEGKGSISAKTAGLKEKIDDLTTVKDAIKARKEEIDEWGQDDEKDVTDTDSEAKEEAPKEEE